MNKLFIKVCGTSASGKSTIGAELRDFLRERGFDADFYDDVQFIDFQEERVEVLKKKGTKIVIETVQLVTDISTGEPFDTFKMRKKDTLCKE